MANENQKESVLTLKDIILVAQDFLRFFRKRWYVFLLLIGIFAAIFAYNHFQKEIRFKSDLRFVVEGQNGTGGGLGGLLGSFGIRKSGGISPFKILEVGKSSNIFLKLLVSKTSDGELIGNKILQVYDLNEKWSEKKPELSDFKFTPDLLERETTQLERIAIRRLMRLMWNKSEDVALCTFKLDELKGIYKISSPTLDEDLSYSISKNLYDFIKEFFEEDVFENQKQFTEILQAKADSLTSLRNQKVRQLAKFNARNLNVINKEVSSEYTILQQEQLAINVALTEVIKNKEMADVNLKDIQPLFLAIDSPFKPLPVMTSSLMFSLVVGSFIGAFLSFVILTILKIYKDAMNS